MIMYNTKNYTEQGGEKTVIGGEIVIEGKITVAGSGKVEGIAGVTGAATDSTLGGIRAAARGDDDTVEVKIDSTTSRLYVAPPTLATKDSAGLVMKAANVATINDGDPVTAGSFNALLTALINAGIMAGTGE